jgi:hypothetical protein
LRAQHGRIEWPPDIGCGVAAQSLYRVGYWRWINRAVELCRTRRSVTPAANCSSDHRAACAVNCNHWRSENSIIRSWPFPGYYRRYLFLFQWLQATFGFFAGAVARMKDVFDAKEFPKWNSAFANESRSETSVSAIMLFTSSLLCGITSFFAK